MRIAVQLHANPCSDSMRICKSYDQTISSLTNAGLIVLSTPASVGTKLTINNDYLGKGGTIVFNTVLAGDSSPTDKLIIGGNVSGNTLVKVRNINGMGMQTIENGIEVVQVDGSSANDAFSLEGNHVDAGAYEYRLFKGNLIGNGNNWYLRSNYRREVPLYGALPAQLRQSDLSMLGNLHQRIGEVSVDKKSFNWGRFIGNNIRIHQDGPSHANSHGSFTGLQIGRDFWTDRKWRVGAYGGYLSGNMTVDGFARGAIETVGRNNTNSFFIGGYGTYVQNNQSYADFIIQGAQYKVHYNPFENTQSTQNDNGITASMEIGKHFGSSNLQAEPQMQIIHQWLKMNRSYISGNTTVRQKNQNAWVFRIGTRLIGNLNYSDRLLKPYIRWNTYLSPSNGDYTIFSTPAAFTKLSSGSGYISSELAAGCSLSLTKHINLHGEIGRLWANGGTSRISSPVQGTLGVRGYL